MRSIALLVTAMLAGCLCPPSSPSTPVRPCVVDQDCNAWNGTWCSSGTCVPDLKPGQPCTSSVQCCSSVCDAAGMCSPPIVDVPSTC